MIYSQICIIDIFQDKRTFFKFYFCEDFLATMATLHVSVLQLLRRRAVNLHDACLYFTKKPLGGIDITNIKSPCIKKVFVDSDSVKCSVTDVGMSAL